MNDGTWFNNSAIKQELLQSTIDTLLMVGVSTLLSVVFGGILGIVLITLKENTDGASKFFAAILGFIVNATRSIPMVIVMFLLIVPTRALIGNASGWQGTAVPLTVGAIPYFARLVESNLSGVERGKVEAAQMMGASRTWILWGVLVREAVPALIQSVTILAITLVGYSAMAGIVGGGGPWSAGAELRLLPAPVGCDDHNHRRHRPHRPGHPVGRRHAQPAGRSPLRGSQPGNEPSHRTPGLRPFRPRAHPFRSRAKKPAQT